MIKYFYKFYENKLDERDNFLRKITDKIKEKIE